MMVSIHAPAWGATRLPVTPLLWLVRFNSRSRVGSDTEQRSTGANYSSFNSRSRVGSDATNRPL